MGEGGAKNASLALAGVRVLALEASISGPHCSRILGDMGAEVIKVEKPRSGDLIRGWDSVVRGLSSGYVWLNGNKRSFAVDIKKPAGREAVQKLAESADVLIENFAPGVADRLGLGAPELCARNRRLVYCSVSGYGQDGPYRDVKAYDLLIQGEAGIIATTGYPDKPAKVGVPIVDLASSMYEPAADK
jgi:itaconate CoA-transferase